jgi:phosphopantetheinyl transferase
MPLALYRNINHRSAFAIWQITEDPETLLADLPENDRRVKLAQHSKGRGEYAASRILAGILCEKNDLTYNGIEKDDCNKPYLIGTNIHISLSHSYPFAAAMIHLDEACGIDIERPQEKIRRIAHKFMNTAEENWTGINLDDLTTIWSAKETLYKIHGRKKLVFKEQMTILPTGSEAKRSLIGLVRSENSEKKYNLGIERIEDFIITFLES